LSTLSALFFKANQAANFCKCQIIAMFAPGILLGANMGVVASD